MPTLEKHFGVSAKTGRSTNVAPPPSSAVKSEFLDVSNKSFGSQVISIVVAAALVVLIGVWVCVWLFGYRRRRRAASAYDIENFRMQQQQVDARRGGIKGGHGDDEVSLENHTDAGRVALVLMAGEEAPTFLAHPTPYLKSSVDITCTRDESPPQQRPATDRQTGVEV